MDELKSALSKVLSEDEINELMNALNKEAINALRINTLKFEENEFDREFHFNKHKYVLEGRIYNKNENPMGKIALHNAGAYYIQEPSAMMVGDLLDINENEVVLDLCAAPGGKSTHIAQKMKNTGLLVANEISGTRVKALSENIERLGVKNCVVTNENSNFFAKRFKGYFDKVIVDAPCSGLGMWRKNDGSKEDWSMEKVNSLLDIQKQLILDAYECLKMGGTLSYSTCTFTKEENEEILIKYITNTKEYENFLKEIFLKFSKKASLIKIDWLFNND